MKIAIFDHLLNDSNAIGKCHRELLSRLATEHEFTVFAIEFDNPCPARIKFVKIPALRYPLLSLMLSFHIIAPIILWWHRTIKGETFDIVQGIGGNFLYADLVYGHFCHRVYLREHKDARPKKPIRRIYSWIYDSIVSLLEPKIYRDAEFIITPSHGLADELKRNFPGANQEKIHVIANPVDLESMAKPDNYDKLPLCETLGFTKDDLVMIFVATGHFERKGLPVLLQAMEEVDDNRLKLIIVGGREYLINEYKDRAKDKGLQNQIAFVGFQHNIRPYLWTSDIFVFPSAYETFSLVSFEAAGANLPLLVSRLYGVEELIKNDYNGWQVDRTASAYAEKLRFALENRDVLKTMGQNAFNSVEQYTPNAFAKKWSKFYQEVELRLAT